MKYKTHLVGGLLLGTITAGTISGLVGQNVASPELFYIGGAVVGSLFPDIDHKGSYIGRRMKIASSVVSSLLKHRGATHSPVVMGGFVFLIYLLSKAFFPLNIMPILLSGFFVGIMSHILLDMITKGGVPLLYPLTSKKINLTNMKTGSNGENFVLFLMVIALVCVGFKSVGESNLIASILGGM